MTREKPSALRAAISKSSYILKEEGLGTLVNRAVRAGIVRLRRQFRNNAPEVARWQELKGRYRGRRAFLLGNGPSLNKTPLHLLRDEFTLCFNRFNLMFERLAWKPSAFSIIDDRVVEDMVDEVNTIVPHVDYAFFPDLHPYNIDFSKRLTPAPNIYWLFLDGLTFSDNLPYCGINKTVANVGLQVLAYLGFEEIYLIGVDMDYQAHGSVTKHNRRDLTSTADDDPNHFDPRYFGEGRRYHHPRMDETLERFIAAREFFEARGCQVSNAGVGGRLEVFPRVDFRSLFPDITVEQELAMLLEPSSVTARGTTLAESVPEAVHVAGPDEWNPAAGAVLAPHGNGASLVARAIPTHIPFGPLGDEYLFLPRNPAA